MSLGQRWHISFYGKGSLTPGCSPVTADGTGSGRFNGLAGTAPFNREKTVETVFLPRPALSTRLKPGVNEKCRKHRIASKRDAPDNPDTTKSRPPFQEYVIGLQYMVRIPP
jgi:hypothetical protein